jgi:hypothetical protein
MDIREFNSLMHFNNEAWAADVLRMQINLHRGPDLIDETKIVEIKFKMLSQNKKSKSLSWKVLDYQLNYKREIEKAYWGLGFYTFHGDIRDIKNIHLMELEERVENRDLYILEWEWMNQFPIYHQSGKTEKTEWNNYLIYPKFKSIPSVVETTKVNGGKIFFTKETQKKEFII